MDLIYRFEETGVGCAKHSDPACLCDVKPVPGGVPIVKLPRLHEYPSEGGNEAFRFILWASGTLGRFEALSGLNQTELNEALAIWEGHGDYANNSQRSAQKGTAASRCLRAGLTLEQTARWLGASLYEILDLFFPRSRHELILKVEPLLRAGRTARQIHEATGANQQWVTGIARRWNIQLPNSGVRFGPEVKQEARRLVKSGVNRRAAARQMGISESRVRSWCEDIPARKNNSYTKEQYDEAIAALAAGLTRKEIHAKLGMPPASLYNEEKKRGLR